MAKIGRLSVTGACLLGLAGCNSVVSLDPWFTAADAEGVPKFRDGLWLTVSDPECRVDSARPAERWPDCARAMFVRGDERLTMEWGEYDGDDRRRRTFAGWEADPTLIVNGEPLIAQYRMEGDPSPDGAAGAGGQESQSWYLYYAIRPIDLDATGEVLAFETWGIQCGPLPEPEPAARSRRRASVDPEVAEDAAYVTERPFPGLTVVDDNCTAENVEALRRAAVLSEPLEAHRTARWIRDGWR